jgi:monothiol glutaredoxin
MTVDAAAHTLLTVVAWQVLIPNTQYPIPTHCIEILYMSRNIFPQDRLHPAIANEVGGRADYRSTVDDVIEAVKQHPVVVVGMRQNPEVKKALQLLDAHPVSYHYLEYGSYFSEWRRRLAIKMWLGWPTYPMVFIKGQFVGGFSDLAQLKNNNQLDTLLADDHKTSA